MNNYNSEWRVWAKVVAVIDLVFVVLQLLVSLSLIVLAGAATAVVVSEHSKGASDLTVEAGFVTWLLWFIVAIMVIQTAVGLWAAVQLLQASELGRDSRDAYKRSQYWQVVCFIFVVLSVLSGITTGNFIWTSIVVLIRMLLMYIVYRFMQEVQTVFITAPHQMAQKV